MRTYKTYRPSINARYKRSLLVEVPAALLLCVFLYTGVDKLFNYRQFKDALSKSPLLAEIAGFVAWVLPIFELFIAVALFIPATRKTGLKATIITLAAFIIYLSYMMVFAPKLPCMCAGLLESLSWKAHIGFNALMIVLAILGIVASGKRSSTGSRAPPE